jgi:hypothetical protein
LSFNIKKYYPFIAALLLFIVVLVIIYPYYKYYIDSDATAYLTISGRYAHGDYQKAINGYWSPWSCWLTALLIKGGGATMLSALIVNAAGAVCFLFISHSFFLFFEIERKWQWTLNIIVALFLCYAVFKQSFDDLWECFFLLSILRIMLKDTYITKQWLWVCCGLLGALAYFAKAYSFPFFFMNTILCNYFLAHGAHTGREFQWIKVCFITFAVMLVCAFPWIYMLHWKYGEWMTSTAGNLNLSWYMAGHPFFKEGITALVPPVYANSPSYWEDPWMVKGHLPHFWSSINMLGRQVARVFYNLILFVKSLNEMSPFMLPVFTLAIGIFISPAVRKYFGPYKFILAVSFLLFPLGFILINFEARYIWYMLLPGMVIGAAALQQLLKDIGSRVQLLVILIYACSFLAWPAWDMRQMFNDGKRQHEIGEQLKHFGVRGGFTANASFGESDFDEVQQIAYYSGNPYYQMPDPNVPFSAVLVDMRKYGIKYFFYYFKPGVNAEVILKDEHGNPLSKIIEFNNFKVFQLN